MPPRDGDGPVSRGAMAATDVAGCLMPFALTALMFGLLALGPHYLFFGPFAMVKSLALGVGLALTLAYIYVFVQRRQRRRHLADAFGSVGLSGQYIIGTSTFEGRWGGRPVTATLIGGKRVRPRLLIGLPLRGVAPLFVSTGPPRPLDLPGEGYRELRGRAGAYPDRLLMARALAAEAALADRDVERAVCALTATELAEEAAVWVLPGRLVLRLFITRIDAMNRASLADWRDHLLALADRLGGAHSGRATPAITGDEAALLAALDGGPAPSKALNYQLVALTLALVVGVLMSGAFYVFIGRGDDHLFGGHVGLNWWLIGHRASIKFDLGIVKEPGEGISDAARVATIQTQLLL